MKQAHFKLMLRRLILIGSGIFFLVMGLLMQKRGQLVWTNWIGQNIFSSGIAALGGFMMMLGFVPTSWVAKLSSTRRNTPPVFRRETPRHSGTR